jgi:hypothetical protein
MIGRMRVVTLAQCLSARGSLERESEEHHKRSALHACYCNDEIAKLGEIGGLSPQSERVSREVAEYISAQRGRFFRGVER